MARVLGTFEPLFLKIRTTLSLAHPLAQPLAHPQVLKKSVTN